MGLPQFKEIFTSPPFPEVIDHIVQVLHSSVQLSWLDFKIVIIDVFLIRKMNKREKHIWDTGKSTALDNLVKKGAEILP